MKLTNEEIAKVFAMYQNSEVINPKFVRTPLSYNNVMAKWYDASDYEREFNGEFWDNRKLLLAPISKISNKAAIEVAKILGINVTGVLIRRKINPLKEPFVQLYFISDGREIVLLNISEGHSLFHANNNRFIEQYYAIEYLKSKSYAVPLFFSPGHWANAKTAIELGIAIEKIK